MSKVMLAVLTTLLPLPVMAEVAGLPLVAGYYAEEGTLCGEGNDATLGYLHDGGFNNSHGMCIFEAVTPQGDGSFVYAAKCSSPEQEVEVLDEGIITPDGPEAFAINNGPMKLRYSYCPPRELPPPFGE